MTVVVVDDKSFDQEVLQSDKPVIVDFWAEWCGPCKAIGPLLEDISEDMKGTVKIVKVNVDENYDTAGNYAITALPTLVAFVSGKEVARHRGATTKSNLTSWIQSAV